jgi:hypothetical protein
MSTFLTPFIIAVVSYVSLWLHEKDKTFEPLLELTDYQFESFEKPGIKSMSINYLPVLLLKSQHLH